MVRNIALIVHDIRSCHNVGSLLRTADAMGVEHVYLTGYTPYPVAKDDNRLPHISQKITAQIHKTALGAEDCVPWTHAEDIRDVISQLRSNGFRIVALEQAAKAAKLPDFSFGARTALLIGHEVEGISPELLALADSIVEIPMLGQKESLNVVQATAMALYQCQFISRPA